MIDVTDEVETKKRPRVNGGSVRDELWHLDMRIGFIEPMGPVLESKDYVLRLVPSRVRDLEQRIFQLEEGDAAT